MPLTDKGEKIMASLKEEYGAERGEQVFYAGANKGTFTGVHDGSEEEKFREVSAKMDALLSRADAFFEAQPAQSVRDSEEKKIEAYGVKGMKSAPWRKTFKNQREFEKWMDQNGGDVQIQGTREADSFTSDDLHALNDAMTHAARKAGRKAAVAGEHRVKDNPHSKGTYDFDMWDQGFTEGKADPESATRGDASASDLETMSNAELVARRQQCLASEPGSAKAKEADEIRKILDKRKSGRVDSVPSLDQKRVSEAKAAIQRLVHPHNYGPNTSPSQRQQTREAVDRHAKVIREFEPGYQAPI